MRRATASREEQALDGEIVGFAAAARKHDLVSFAAEQRRDLRARRLQGCLGADARPVAARRIAERPFNQRPHGCGDRRIDRRARVVVEVDVLHAYPRFLPFQFCGNR